MTTRHGRPIVVVGSFNTDMIIKTTRLPGPGETVLGGRFHMAPGGKGANQAAARAGGRVHFIARVGGDLFGDSALQGFRRDEIHVNHVLVDEGAHSGIALIIVNEDGENSIAVASGANARLSPDDIRRARDTIGRAGILLVQLEIPMETVEEAVRFANAAAAISVTRMGAQPSAPNREEIEAFLGARANGQS
jgi:ribokinase